MIDLLFIGIRKKHRWNDNIHPYHHYMRQDSKTELLFTKWDPIRNRLSFRVCISIRLFGISVKLNPDRGTNMGAILGYNLNHYQKLYLTDKANHFFGRTMFVFS